MMRLARSLRDDRGVAAIEFALILPILVALVLFGMEGWMRINQVSQMRSALSSASRYYESGGSDDTAAAQLAIASWNHAPGDGAVNAVRSCTCGGVGAGCNTLCAGNSLPNVYVTMTATGTFTGIMHTAVLSQTGAVRIR
jgi:Flp pilus assembly protein TadG